MNNLWIHTSNKIFVVIPMMFTRHIDSPIMWKKIVWNRVSRSLIQIWKNSAAPINWFIDVKHSHRRHMYDSSSGKWKRVWSSSFKIVVLDETFFQYCYIYYIWIPHISRYLAFKFYKYNVSSSRSRAFIMPHSLIIAVYLLVQARTRAIALVSRKFKILIGRSLIQIDQTSPSNIQSTKLIEQQTLLHSKH